MGLLTHLQRVPTEYDEACWLKEWATLRVWNGHRLSHLLIHIPNGAYLGADKKTRGITMGKLKATGLRPGVFDYLLAVPCLRLGIPGLWIELKRTKGGRVEPEQQEFEHLMIELGYRTQISPGWKHAADAIDRYLDCCGARSAPIGNQKPKPWTPP